MDSGAYLECLNTTTTLQRGHLGISIVVREC